MAKSNQFIKQYFGNKKEIGAIAPSSKFLRNRMMAPISFHSADVIIELGAGNGVFTKEIIKRMKSSCKLFVFETNELFFELLSNEIKDDRVVFFNDSAELINQKLSENGIKCADAIVSSLPYAVFPSEVKNNILDACVSILNKEGVYVQFQYSLNAHKLLKHKFTNVTLDFTPINMPPAFIYRCRP
ncbi:MAG: phospholipid methyltransferase [Crocinitomicaceae bacterium]|nr:phospholipid methyltransferase [Crocinitomicaceae bacterium]